MTLKGSAFIRGNTVIQIMPLGALICRVKEDSSRSMRILAISRAFVRMFTLSQEENTHTHVVETFDKGQPLFLLKRKSSQ